MQTHVRMHVCMYGCLYIHLWPAICTTCACAATACPGLLLPVVGGICCHLTISTLQLFNSDSIRFWDLCCLLVQCIDFILNFKCLQHCATNALSAANKAKFLFNFVLIFLLPFYCWCLLYLLALLLCWFVGVVGTPFPFYLCLLITVAYTFSLFPI